MSLNDYMNKDILGLTLLSVLNGKLVHVADVEFQRQVNDYVLKLLANPSGWTQDDCCCVDSILRISNILYNNTSKTVLLLDDGVYDQLLVIYKNYNPNYQVGATPVHFPEMNDEEPMIDGKKLLYHVVSDKDQESAMFANDLQAQHTPLTAPLKPIKLYSLIQEPISKRLINTQHKYPELVGTLDKCKFVLNEDARQAGVFDEPSVQVFERDFLSQCAAMGIIQPGEVFEMCCELKYDGVSVEAEVAGNRIITALSRGDTGANIATDLTPIFKGYRFWNSGMQTLIGEPYHQAVKSFEQFKLGIKFEAVITKRNLELLGQIRGKEYKNARNAIIGLLGASDAYRFTDFITLIPIASSEGGNREAELYFLNHFYSSGEYNRHIFIRGDYASILYQVREFVRSAETIRPILPYMIDGVVISFTDPNKIKMLGRANSVNKWQMAIKFNAKQARSIFLGYSFSMGKSGTIIPMVHFKPVEFIGTIHTKQTIHSYQRFKELCLVKGQEIDITYVNDVLTYINKPLTKHNEELQVQYTPEPFIERCPYCGSELELSETTKSVRCPNTHCHERAIMRMIDAIERLGFKDINEQVVRTLDLTSFKDLFEEYNKEDLEMKLGPATANKFLDYLFKFQYDPLPEYDFLAAMCFDDMGIEKWKRVLKVYELPLLLAMNEDQLRENLNQIKGVGTETVNAIIRGFRDYAEDIRVAISVMTLIPMKDCGDNRPKAVITGARDTNLIAAINNAGYDCSESYGVTKDTALLICDSYTSGSGKMQKAQKYGIEIISIEDFLAKHHITL